MICFSSFDKENSKKNENINFRLRSLARAKIYCSTVTFDIEAFSLKLKLVKHRHFLTSVWLWFKISSISFGKIFWYAQTSRVWQKETFKIEKSRGCPGSFFVFSIFCVFWLSENLVLQIFLINWKQGKLIRNNFSAKS